MLRISIFKTDLRFQSAISSLQVNIHDYFPFSWGPSMSFRIVLTIVFTANFTHLICWVGFSPLLNVFYNSRIIEILSKDCETIPCLSKLGRNGFFRAQKLLLRPLKRSFAKSKMWMDFYVISTWCYKNIRNSGSSDTGRQMKSILLSPE